MKYGFGGTSSARSTTFSADRVKEGPIKYIEINTLYTPVRDKKVTKKVGNLRYFLYLYIWFSITYKVKQKNILMITDDKFTEIFRATDEFSKKFDEELKICLFWALTASPAAGVLPACPTAIQGNKKRFLCAKVPQNRQSTRRKCYFLFPKWFQTRKSVLISTLRTYLPMVVLCWSATCETLWPGKSGNSFPIPAKRNSSNGCIARLQHYNHGIRKCPQARTRAFVSRCHKTGNKWSWNAMLSSKNLSLHIVIRHNPVVWGYGLQINSYNLEMRKTLWIIQANWA